MPFSARSLHPLLVIAVVALAACGGSDTGGADAEEADAAYFGVTQGECLLYAGGSAGVQRMTIGVEGVDEALLGFSARRVVYRLGGVVRRIDLVTVEDGALLLHRREIPGAVQDRLEFDPPVVLLTRPYRVTGGTAIRTDTTARDVGSGTTSEWTVEVLITPMEDVSVPAQEESYATFPVFSIFRPEGVAPEQDRFWMVPGLGPVQVDLHGDLWPEMSLIDSWTMQEGDTQCTPPVGVVP